MTASPRWAQLTYTSYDDGVGAGGWQVKQTQGELSEDESQELRSQIRTNLSLHDSLPTFPTADEIAALPRRLVYRGRDDGSGCFWHTSYAGPDATGRPGNVFVHAALDRDNRSTDPSRRPIDLWRSPSWLVPFGADEVRAASLDEGAELHDGPLGDATAIVEFVCDPGEWRVGVLGPLLDAVASALGGNQRVVMGCDDSDAAAMWIAAVSRLLPPVLAARFNWSTYERADFVDTAAGRALDLIGVPTADLASIEPRPELAIINTTEIVALGEFRGEAHVTHAGSRIVVTPWSILAEAIFEENTAALETLARLDEIAARTDTSTAPQAWALAAAMSVAENTFDDSAEIIRMVLLTGPPLDVRQTPELADRVARHVEAAVGDDVARAWDHVRQASGASAEGPATDTYLRLAINDPAWLAQPGGAPVPATAHSRTVALRNEFDARMLDAVSANRDTATPATAAQALQLLEFAVRARIIDAATALQSRSVLELLGPQLAQQLISAEGPMIARSARPLPRPDLRQRLQSTLDAALRERASERLPELESTVAAWLFEPELPLLSLQDLVRTNASGERPVPSVSYIAAILDKATAAGSSNAEVESWVAALAVWFLLNFGQKDSATPARLDEVSQLPLAAHDLRLLLNEFGPELPSRLLLGALQRLPWSEAQEIARQVARFNSYDGMWSDGVARQANVLARIRICSNTEDPRPEAWVAESLAALDAAIDDRVELGIAGAEFARLVITAALTASFGQLTADLTGRTAHPLVYGTALPRTTASTSLAMTTGAPRPTPRANMTKLPTNVVREELDFQCKTVPVEVVLQLLDEAAHARLIDPEMVLAVALVAAPGGQMKLARACTEANAIGALVGSDGHQLAETMAVHLIAHNRVKTDNYALEVLVDKLGLAEFGRAAWKGRDSERSAWLKTAKRRVRDLAGLADKLAPAGEKAKSALPWQR